jgi:hypothetical protein
MFMRTLIPAAIALVAAGCGTQADPGSAGAADVSAYAGTSGGGRADNAQSSDADGGVPKDVAAIDPCALVTREEIITQIEASYQADQLAGFKSKGGTWEVTPNPQQEGISKACRYAFKGTVQNGDVSYQSEFKVIVTNGAFVNGDVNNAKARPLPGVGDEAYFMSRGPMMPYARVGDVAVGIEGFPSTPTAKAGADLLRAAVSRVR